MIKNERIEAAYQQLVEAIKEELANGCEVGVKADAYSASLTINQNERVDIRVVDNATSMYISTFSFVDTEEFKKYFESVNKEIITQRIAVKEKEIEELKKGL